MKYESEYGRHCCQTDHLLEVAVGWRRAPLFHRVCVAVAAPAADAGNGDAVRRDARIEVVDGQRLEAGAQLVGRQGDDDGRVEEAGLFFRLDKNNRLQLFS